MPRSDNWRLNKSSLMAVEGAQLLRALQKVAGAVGLPKDYTVKFATKARDSGIDFNAKELVIGAGRIFQEAPLPADKMDVLVGLALHEAGHYTIRTDKVYDMVSSTISSQEGVLFQTFVNIGEDIVIESMTRANPNLADYDKALHNWAVTQMREAKPHKLLELWIEYGLGHKVDYAKMDNLPEELKDAMSQLVALTGWLRRVPESYGDRARTYLKYWSAVKNTILNPPKPPPQKPQQGGDSDSRTDGTCQSGETTPDKPNYNQSEPDKDKDNSGSSKSGAEQKSPQNPEPNNNAAGQTVGDKSSTPDDSSQSAGGRDGNEDEPDMDRPLAPTDEDGIDDDLADAIKDAVETEQEDITEEVQELFNQNTKQNSYQRTYSIIRSRETKTPLIKPDTQLRGRLERIMTIRKRLQARTMHGEQYGRIDKRHLYRVGTDERIFSLQYKFPDGFPNTRILIDLSGSMSGQQADEVLEAAGALQSLVNAEVWCYYYDGDIVKLIRVDDGKLIHRLEPDGATPSGLAIVGVSLGMKKDGLVIHLTDGEHNTGQKPWNAHWILQKRGINLINLIWGKSISQYDWAGMNWKQLDGLGDFPDALYSILVEQSKLTRLGK